MTAPYFAGAAAGELRVPLCERCVRYVWYPEPVCPDCGGGLQWVVLSGRGTLFSWAVVQRPFLPAFAEQVPFVTALVALDEDPFVRIVTYVVDIEAEALVADLPLDRRLPPALVPDRARSVGRRAGVPPVIPLFLP